MRLDRTRQTGLTIIELVIFMVVIGVASAGLMLVLNMGAKNTADPLRRKQAMLIAEGYMEEVRQAAFTLCYPEDANATTANAVGQCASPPGVQVQARSGIVRPYGNVADYATALGTPQRSFQKAGGDDVDVNGRALGRDDLDATMGNSSLGAITTTLTLNVLPAGDTNAMLGPAGKQIASSANDLNVLRITVTTRYGSGDNDVIQLDGYRTRYAPRFVP
jgi:MSHA pilin protein MshD